MGMLKEGVRLDRVRGGRQKYRRNPSANPYQLLLPQSTTNIAPSTLEDIKMLEILTLGEPELLSVGHGGCDLMEVKTEDKQTSTVTLDGKMGHDAQEMLSVLSDIYDKELVGVIGWAKQITGKRTPVYLK